MNLGAFFAAPVSSPTRSGEHRKKPGYPLQFLSPIAGRLRDFRFYPLRGSVSRTGSFAGKFRGFISTANKLRIRGAGKKEWG
jgi:hypothetical protein